MTRILDNLKRMAINTPAQSLAEKLIRKPIAHLRAIHKPFLRERVRLESVYDKAFASLLKPGENYIDIGAHIGSVLAQFVQASPNGAHIAFEPTPEKAAFLRKKFPAVDIHAVALSTEPGDATFFVNPDQPGFNSMEDRGDQFGETNKITVPVETLDNRIPQNRKFSVIKIDVEGLELSVLKGGRGFIDRDQPTIVFECGPALANSEGVIFGDDLFRYITEEMGYIVYGPQEFADGKHGLTLDAFRNHRTFPFAGFDFIAKPKSC